MAPISTIGLASGIVELINATTKVISYLHGVKDAPKERGNLTLEAANLLTLLSRLRFMVEEAESLDDVWYTNLRSLVEKPNSAFNILKDSLDDLAQRLDPSLNLMGLRWQFIKYEAADVLQNIQRLQNLVEVALSGDSGNLSDAIAEHTKMVQEIQETLSQVEQARQERRENEPDSDLIATKEFLSPLDFLQKQRAISKLRQAGSCQWFLEAEEFQAWVNSSRGRMWCPGMPGTGKSVMVSAVYESLLNRFPTSEAAVVCVYCSYEECDNQSATELIGGIWRQLVTQRGDALNDAREWYQTHLKNGTRPDQAEITRILDSELESHPKIFLLVDALDECPEDTRTQFLKVLCGLPPQVNILATSRFNESIEDEFLEKGEFSKPFDEQTAEKHTLTINANSDDIGLYVKSRILHERRLLRNINAYPSLMNEIIAAVLERAGGTFLLARLHMDSLSLSSCPGSVRHRLPSLPDTLDKAYADTMRRIEQQAQEDYSLAIVVLSWLSAVVRPLTKWELIHAISTRSGQDDISRSRVPIEELLTSVCAGLVVIEEETFIIRLVHATAQEYYRRMRRRLFPKASKIVARTCLAYLSFDVFDKGPCSSRLELQNRLRSYPFYAYAASHWAAHMWGHREKTFEVGIRDFLLAKRKVASAIQCRNSASDLATFDMYPRNVSPISYAASLGLTYT
ncbi:hypothetical protein AOQ84DRAFT_388931, partial [Glonium stellatum]